jgi:hypothetical protein
MSKNPQIRICKVSVAAQFSVCMNASSDTFENETRKLMSKKTTRKPQLKKPNLKNPRMRALTSDDYSQVLYELGGDVAFGKEAGGSGVVIFIKPGKIDGRPIVLTESLFYSDPDDKDFHRALSEAMHSDKQWAVWDIFHN